MTDILTEVVGDLFHDERAVVLRVAAAGAQHVETSIGQRRGHWQQLQRRGRVHEQVHGVRRPGAWQQPLSFERRDALVTHEPVSLGSYALQLGLTALRRLDLTRHSGETLRALSEATQKAVYLAVWGNHGPCIVQRVDGQGPQPMSLQVGYVLPALSTATGRVFLAYLPSARYDPILERERRFASTRLPSPADMERTRSEVRARGIAHTDGQLNVGFSALSAPIFDHAGEIAAALTAIGPTPTFDDSLEGSTALKLRDAAARLSRTLRWLEGTEPSDAAVSKRGWRSDEGDG